METTTLIVEIVIIGFQVLIWISLIPLTIWGYSSIDLSTLKDWTVPITVAMISVSYTLGLIFDAVIGLIFRRQSFYIQRETFTVNPTVISIQIRMKDENAYNRLEQMYRQSQLLRSTSVNLILIGIMSAIFITKHIGMTQQIGSFLSGVFIPLSLLAIWAWNRQIRIFNHEMITTFEQLTAPEQTKVNKRKKTKTG